MSSGGRLVCEVEDWDDVNVFDNFCEPTASESGNVIIEETRENVSTAGRTDAEKRRRNKRAIPEKWKRNVVKQKKLHGEAYTSARGVEVPAREILPRCPEKCKRQ
jgi:hypothetical protein